MAYKKVRTQIIIFLFFCSTLCLYANNEIDNQINTILETKSIENTKKFNSIITIIETSSVLTELEKSQYYHDISALFYKQYKLLKLAIIGANKAVLIRRKYKDTNLELLEKSLFNLGFFYRKSGAINIWYETYTEILKLGKEDRYHAKVYVAFGKFYRKTGDFVKALENLEKAQRYFEDNNNKRELFLTHLSLSYLYTDIGRLKYSNEITKHLEQADSLNTNFSSAETEIAKEKDLFIIKQRLGNLALEKNEFNTATVRLNEALEIALKQKDTSNLALVYNNLGNIYLKVNKYPKAYATLKTAESYANNNILKSLINNSLGDYYCNTEAYKNAELNYLSAFNLLNNVTETRLPKATELLNVPNKLDALSYLEDIANFYYKQYQLNTNKQSLNKGLETIIMADRLVDIIRSGSTENRSKLIWRERGSGIYMKGVEISYLLKKSNQAFYFMEKNKSLLLIED
jgi:tetratricopeptide (TPR) repeat protein